MLEITKSLRDILVPKSFDSTNTVWRLHSRITVYMLVFFTILLSARSYFGEPIECISSAAPTVRASLHSFCWTLGTYISRDPNFVEASWDIIEIGTHMGHIPKEERLYQKYYQWVPFLLAIQAFLFSFPKHLWRFCERGRLETLCHNLTSILSPGAWTRKRKALTLLYLTQESRKGHNKYALIFIGCEILNFFIVLLNMFLMNFLFGGFWASYQPAIQALLSLDMNAWTSYNSLVFPKLAKCDFSYIGPSGSKQNFDALCLLPQNIVNEKIFAFLWLWFIVLAVVSGVQLCYRLAQLSCRSVRFQLLFSLLDPISYHRLKRVVREANIGYWFLLYQMARNINKGVMREIIRDLSRIDQELNMSKSNVNELQLEVEAEDELEEIEDDEATV
ncbi:AAEL006726-PA [Aedes aegypti]|uniref:Innexin n=2 Tax=Aedes aegypti TaxID=7159 RepID=A0A1S4FED9_AEDAE|nr:innexin inx4 [Aedes aegypti]EAT41633.1 AAEL006726-PA [Aedes aegypti]